MKVAYFLDPLSLSIVLVSEVTLLPLKNTLPLHPVQNFLSSEVFWGWKSPPLPSLLLTSAPCPSQQNKRLCRKIQWCVWRGRTGVCWRTRWGWRGRTMTLLRNWWTARLPWERAWIRYTGGGKGVEKEGYEWWDNVGGYVLGLCLCQCATF